MSQPRDDRQDDLFRPSLEKIINVRHPLVRLVAGIDWDFLAGRFSSVWGDREQRPWRELKFLRTRLGGVIRDIRRKIEGDIALEDRFGSLLDLAHRVRHQTAASAWTQGLFAACARGGVHRQGKVRAPYAVLAAAGCNFSLLLRRLEELLRVLL
jgi:hypothetical protein